MRAALALHIGRERAADLGTFVPPQPEPVQILDDRLAEFRTASHQVEVFNAKNQLASCGTGPLLSDPKRAGMTDVEISCRRRGQTPAISDFRAQIFNLK